LVLGFNEFMKKIALTLFVMFFIAQSLAVVADDPDSAALLNQAVQQSSCGKINSPCCQEFSMSKIRVNIPLPGTWKVITDPLFEIVNSMILKLTDPIVGLISSFVKNVRQGQLCAEGLPSNTTDLSKCVCLPKETFKIAQLCTYMKGDTEKKACVECSKVGVWTAIGCVDFRLETFVRQKVFSFGIGLAGIVSFFCILYSAFVLQTSQGNPERIKKAQQLLTSCITGLLLIIFSVFILRLVGVEILRIPGFGK
jgi:hypothetical protein